MRLDAMITSAPPVGDPYLDRRQATSTNSTTQSVSDLTVPANCYGPCDKAALEAQSAQQNCSQLCPTQSPFLSAYSNCAECITQLNPADINTPVDSLLTELYPFISYCSVCNQENATQATLLFISSVAGSCAAYTYLHHSIPADCSAWLGVNTESQAGSSPSVGPSPTRASVSPTPLESASGHSDTAAIVGGVVGGVGGLVLVIIIFLFFFIRGRRRRRAQMEAAETGPEGHEKAQLHSDDVKPDRKELEGTKATSRMLEKQPTDLSELPANEEVVTKNRLKEMPSNEPAGHEMETTENEIAALDRMARMTDSTTLGNSSSNNNNDA